MQLDVLVVEDNPSKVAKLIAEYSELFCGNWIVVNNEEDAFEVHLYQHPRTIFLDHELVSGSGLGLARRLTMTYDLKVYITTLSTLAARDIAAVLRAEEIPHEKVF